MASFLSRLARVLCAALLTTVLATQPAAAAEKTSF